MVDRYFACYEEITPQVLAEEGVKLLICDLDFTLTPRWCHEPTAHFVTWIYACRDAGTEVVVMTNNRSERRVKRFCDFMELPYKYWAKKPDPEGVFYTMKAFNVKPANTVMLGDRWLTDMLCAKNAGVRGWKVPSRNRP